MKRIEKEQLAQRLESAFEKKDNPQLLSKLEIGIGIEDRMGSGLNLSKMSQYITENKIKSSPHAMMHSGSQSNFKMKIDTF